MKFLLPLFALFFGVTINLSAQQFRVSYPVSAMKEPFTGQVILYLSQKNQEPKNQLGWPCYRMEVRNVKPGQPVVFSDRSLSYPTLLSRIPRGDYYVQAVWDRNLEGREIGRSTGNLYSTARKLTLNDPADVFDLICDQVIPAPVFVETKFVKELKAPSALLSRFHKKQMTINAAVILPAEYFDQPEKRFPVFLTVAGYGGSYIHYSSTESSDTLPANKLGSTPCIRVYLDGDCPLGHSTYANSANNGPLGDAFATEFIPLLDQKFRTEGHVIRGHSSGGWTVVYLMTHYPGLFIAGNASAPDPVDFHQFVDTNLYTDTKRIEFVDALTIGRKPEIPVEYDQPNIAHSIEEVVYRGEQNVSFDAVFGPRGKNGLPQPLYNPATGEMDKKVFEHWKKYDLTQYVVKNWPKVKDNLNGKLRFSVGTEDFLRLPVMLMEKEMMKLHADIEFAYYPGTHFTVGTPEYKKAEMLFLEGKYLDWKEGSR